MYRGRREFRAGVALRLMTIGATALFTAVAVIAYRARGWSWITIGLAVAVVVGVAGMLKLAQPNTQKRRNECPSTGQEHVKSGSPPEWSCSRPRRS
jgi:hypothetical protein